METLSDSNKSRGVQYLLFSSRFRHPLCRRPVTRTYFNLITNSNNHYIIYFTSLWMLQCFSQSIFFSSFCSHIPKKILTRPYYFPFSPNELCSFSNVKLIVGSQKHSPEQRKLDAQSGFKILKTSRMLR